MSTKTPPPPPPPPPQKGKVKRGQKIGIYGTGGIGKTELVTLARLVGKKVLILDIDDGCMFLDVETKSPQTWDELLAILGDVEFLRQYDLVAVDSFTRAEELAKAWMLQNIMQEKTNKPVTSIEGYGWGKGYVHLYETFLRLLGALDSVARSGIDVVHVSHDCTSVVPHPGGDDYLRYEPRLQKGTKTGEASIRNRVKEWSDHLLFVGYDIFSKDGKAQGGGTRTIFPLEMPTHMAKTRSLTESSLVYTQGDPAIWRLLFNVE